MNPSYMQYVFDEHERKARKLFQEHSALETIYLRPNPLVGWTEQGLQQAAKLIVALWRWGQHRVQHTRWVFSPPSEAQSDSTKSAQPFVEIDGELY